MGLDMSLYRVPAEVELPEFTPEERENYWETVEKTGVFDKSEEVAYWRKFNALHGWFVENCQDGIDECQYSSIGEEQLKELVDLLEESLTSGKALLEPVGGFFFGSTEVDSWYWDDVRRTHEELKDILENTDFSTHYLMYSSSW